MLPPDPTNSFIEGAKAVQEGAKAVQEVVQAASAAGKLVSKALGPATSNLFEALEVYTGEVKIRTTARCRAKTAKLLEGIGLERLSLPSPSVVGPLIAAAQEETREALADLWAAMLANAFVDGGRKVRAQFFDIASHLEPADVIYLDTLAHDERWRKKPTSDQEARTFANSSGLTRTWFDAALGEAGLNASEMGLAAQALSALNLIGNPFGGALPPLTRLGRGLIDAVTVV